MIVSGSIRAGPHPAVSGAQHALTLYDAVLPTPCAGVSLGISMQGDAVMRVDFLDQDAELAQLRPSSGASRRAAMQLLRYFSHPATKFSLKLLPRGSEFQLRVWRALRDIPAGRTVSYGDLARELKTSPRAIGGACRVNPIPILIPCHRVVAVKGIGGFMGSAWGPEVEIKRWLLGHEIRI